MCNFLSAFVKYVGDGEIEMVRIDHLTDSHSEAARRLGLPMDGDAYAKVEFVPGHWRDTSSWTFILDEDRKPRWWSDDVRAKAISLLYDAIESMRDASGRVVRTIELADGSKEWYRDGDMHRDDGPAVERASGSKEWWRDGKRHRDDGPAVEWADGYKEWWRDGKLHKAPQEDRPA